MFTLKIKTDNSAFADTAGEEAARILREVARKLEDGFTSGLCIDYNGNRVGKWCLNHEPEED